MKKEVLLMVGPTTVPERVLQAMNRKSISHRSKEYCDMHQRIKGLKDFRTQNEVFILTSSGTELWRLHYKTVSPLVMR